jgi:hypothetical protein
MRWWRRKRLLLTVSMLAGSTAGCHVFTVDELFQDSAQCNGLGRQPPASRGSLAMRCASVGMLGAPENVRLLESLVGAPLHSMGKAVQIQLL